MTYLIISFHIKSYSILCCSILVSCTNIIILCCITIHLQGDWPGVHVAHGDENWTLGLQAWPWNYTT